MTTMNCRLTAPHLSLIHSFMNQPCEAIPISQVHILFLSADRSGLDAVGVIGPISARGREFQSTTTKGALQSSKGGIINGSALGK